MVHKDSFVHGDDVSYAIEPCFQSSESTINRGWKTEESCDYCLHQKDDCDFKFDVKRRYIVGSAKS